MTLMWSWLRLIIIFNNIKFSNIFCLFKIFADFSLSLRSSCEL